MGVCKSLTNSRNSLAHSESSIPGELDRLSSRHLPPECWDLQCVVSERLLLNMLHGDYRAVIEGRLVLL